MSQLKVLLPVGMGLNCEDETELSFKRSGALVKRVFINDLLKNPKELLEYNLLCFMGGFSFGDHLGAGTVLASKFKAYLHKELEEFVKRGRLILGICNGFQVMVRLGLFSFSFPLFEQEFLLSHNDNYQFRNDWVSLKVNRKSPCIFTRGMDFIDLPIRHGEGKFSCINEKVLLELQKFEGICLQYADPSSGELSKKFPLNPNGSLQSIAGICNKRGRVFGLMPHPEAYLFPWHHPDWIEQRKKGDLPNEGLGLSFFRNAVSFAEKNF